MYSQISQTTQICKEIVRELWRILPAIIARPLFEASQFLCASLTDFSFPGDYARDYLGEPGRKPASFFEQVRVEGAVINAYKSIEAVIGDPPKDPNKLARKLKDLGVDPAEQVEYRDERTRSLAEAIMELRSYRDQRAAHGSTPSPRETTYRQLHEFQTIALRLLWAAVDRRLGVPKRRGSIGDT